MLIYGNNIQLCATSCDVQIHVRLGNEHGQEEAHTLFLPRVLALHLIDGLRRILEEPIPPITNEKGESIEL